MSTMKHYTFPRTLYSKDFVKCINELREARISNTVYRDKNYNTSIYQPEIDDLEIRPILLIDGMRMNAKINCLTLGLDGELVFEVEQTSRGDACEKLK